MRKMYALCLPLLTVLSLLLSLEAFDSSESQNTEKEALDSLPQDSVLRARVMSGQRGSGVELLFMAKMRELGVRRVLFEIDATWTGRLAKDPHVANRVYFSQYDGPDTQIASSDVLLRIRETGLQALLDTAVLQRAPKALFEGFDDDSAQRRRFQRKQKSFKVYSVVGLFDNPWLPEFEMPFFPKWTTEQGALGFAATIGDKLKIDELLATKKFSKKVLDDALFDSVQADYDNTAVIKSLIDAGANVEARKWGRKTPLMLAVGRPPHVRILLTRGAEPNDTDSEGDTPLSLATRQHQKLSAELLKQAGAR